MPYKPKKPCSYPGCPKLVAGRFCEEHAKQDAREYNRRYRHPDSNKIYGGRWRIVRNMYIAARPLCEECLAAGRCVRAEEVHHIIPVAQGGSHAEENLRSLCRSCHAKTRSN
ncbi:MAG: HNH endonuclease [Oscillospiraceae bacterium]|nr:HNH endonuclease [Oscillospiraceae bacterium]